MSEIKFNCPHCGQSLAVDEASAGMSVACPECGQTIGVPKSEWPEGEPAPEQMPARGRGSLWPAIVGVVLVLLIATGALLWVFYGHTGAVAGKTPAPRPALPQDLTRGLVLYFNFDSAPTDGKVPDLSGQGNNGEATNVEWTANGHRGGALILSPNDSHIRVPNNESLNPPQFTLCAWIKTSRTDRYWRRIFDKGLFHNEFSVSVAGDWKKWNPPTKFRGFIEFETLKSAETTSRGSLADGQWHHIVATYDGQDKELFVDGQLQAKTHRPNISFGNDFDLVIGGFTDPDPDNDDPHASFDGSLDDVMMFNRALPLKEAQALYDSQKTAADGGS